MQRQLRRFGPVEGHRRDVQEPQRTQGSGHDDAAAARRAGRSRQRRCRHFDHAGCRRTLCPQLQGCRQRGAHDRHRDHGRRQYPADHRHEGRRRNLLLDRHHGRQDLVAARYRRRQNSRYGPYARNRRRRSGLLDALRQADHRRVGQSGEGRGQERFGDHQGRNEGRRHGGLHAGRRRAGHGAGSERLQRAAERRTPDRSARRRAAACDHLYARGRDRNFGADRREGRRTRGQTR